jgi:RNA polymerase sigma-70 factor (ECF subfamily)
MRALWEEHSGPVLAYTLRRLRSKDAAEDIVSETFMIAWRKIDQVPAEPLPWLLGIARRVLSHHYRSHRSRIALQTRLEQEADSPAAAASPGEDIGELRRIAAVLRSLNDSDREVLALVDWEGLRNREAALALGITPVALAVRLHRARRRLAAAIAKAEDRATTVALTTSGITRRD